MTKAEFYTLLAATPGNGFSWSFEGTGEAIRAKSSAGQQKSDGCIVDFYTPITAVMLMIAAKAYHPADDKKAGDKLGLSTATIDAIVHGSDFSMPSFDPMERKRIKHALSMRAVVITQ